MGLPGYDNWKLATPPEYEQSGAIGSAIDNDAELSALQRRADRRSERRDTIAAALKAETAAGPRYQRLTHLHGRLVRLAKYAADDLQDAIEDRADDGAESFYDTIAERDMDRD